MSLDLDTYRSLSAKLETDDIDFSSFRDQPLSPDALRCLRSMHDVENHTVCYLRDVLVTRAHKDPDITSFLTMWNFEEYWHGEAIAEYSMPTTSRLAPVGSPRSVSACPSGMPGGHLPSSWARSSPPI
jgi:hypothetical protein